MSETNKKKTAFATPHRGLFHFNLMPFGLTNAPGTFQRLMERVLVNLTPSKCLCYLDDIIILGHNFDSPGKLERCFPKIKGSPMEIKA